MYSWYSCLHDHTMILTRCAKFHFLHGVLNGYLSNAHAHHTNEIHSHLNHSVHDTMYGWYSCLHDHTMILTRCTKFHFLHGVLSDYLSNAHAHHTNEIHSH